MGDLGAKKIRSAIAPRSQGGRPPGSKDKTPRKGRITSPKPKKKAETKAEATRLVQTKKKRDVK